MKILQLPLLAHYTVLQNLHLKNLIKEMFYKTNLKFIINRFGVIAGPWQFGKQDQGFVPYG